MPSGERDLLEIFGRADIDTRVVPPELEPRPSSVVREETSERRACSSVSPSKQPLSAARCSSRNTSSWARLVDRRHPRRTSRGGKTSAKPTGISPVTGVPFAAYVDRLSVTMAPPLALTNCGATVGAGLCVTRDDGAM